VFVRRHAANSVQLRTLAGSELCPTRAGLTIPRVDAQLSRLFDTQGGVVTSAQALTHLTRRGLEAELNYGVLQKVWYGIYGRGEMTTALLLRGLDLAAGTTVAVCLNTAAEVYGFATERDTALHVLNPGGRQLRPTRGLVVHRREGAPLTMVAGRPATTPAWTAIEVARTLRRPRALATLDAALRTGTCSRDDLARMVRLQSGRRGIVATRALLPLASALAESPMESEARLVMIDGGLPPPILQHEVVDLQGHTWRLDFAWPDRRVAAEYDGVDWHSGSQAFFRDRRRGAALQDLGWVVVPVVAEDVRHRPVELVRRIEMSLARAA
jgi:hypothetical protein